MSNYNTTLQSNNTDLQTVLQTLQTKAAGGNGIDTSDATATADKIFLNETAYADGKKVTGTFTIDSELTTQDDLISQIQTALEGKASGVTLPTLTNPGTAENLEEGYELIDGTGNIIVGTHICESGAASNMISVTVTNESDSSVFYFDAEKMQQEIPSPTTKTVQALNGTLYYRQSIMTTCTGDYVRGMLAGVLVAVFVSNGGTMTCYNGNI